MLRRFAQQNNAAVGSPRASESSSVPPSTPPARKARPSLAAFQSPTAAPSLSASVPFDWEAARSYAPPPYGTPMQRKVRKSMGIDATPNKTPRKALVRKKSLLTRCGEHSIPSTRSDVRFRVSDMPSTIAFHISMFPQNLPLPSARTSSRIIAGTMHFAHFILRLNNSRHASSWDDLYVEEDDHWLDWVSQLSLLTCLALIRLQSTIVTFLLFAFSVANASYLFSRTRKYHFHQRQDIIASPNAKFVSKDWDTETVVQKTLWKRVLSGLWWCISASFRFLLNMSPPSTTPTSKTHSNAKVQELDVWAPGDLELQLFSLYSPVHSLLWLATGVSNWIVMLMSMGLLTIMVSLQMYNRKTFTYTLPQLNFLIFTYQTLIKDKEYIASEVLSEYNQKVRLYLFDGRCYELTVL